MAHMIPVAEHFAAYHVETSAGTEIVPEDVCGKLDDSPSLTPYESVGNAHRLADYIEGDSIESVERKEGWYGRLSAPGYLDCTSWEGPYETAEAAIYAVCEQFDVDENGDDADSDGQAEYGAATARDEF